MIIHFGGIGLNELFTKIAAEKRERVIEAAILEFAANGYENANTNTIAKNAKISVGSLFQYFKNKEDLFMFIVEHCSQILIGAFNDVVSDSDTFFVTVEKILRRLIKESRENPNYIKLYFELTTPSKSYIERRVVNEMESYSSKLYRQIILKGQSEGVIRQDCDLSIFPFLLDNLFVMLQYSFSCGYYQERFKIYGGEDILGHDDQIVSETLKFIKGAFSA